MVSQPKATVVQKESKTAESACLTGSSNVAAKRKEIWAELSKARLKR